MTDSETAAYLRICVHLGEGRESLESRSRLARQLQLNRIRTAGSAEKRNQKDVVGAGGRGERLLLLSFVRRRLGRASQKERARAEKQVAARLRKYESGFEMCSRCRMT